MSSPNARRTVPLTKAQLQTAAGAELLALCQSVTEDGVVTDQEVGALRDWLERNRSSDLPSVGFLVATVEKILADGRIDPWERRDLHKALERVLPPEARAKAKEARDEAERREFMNDPRALHSHERVGELYDFMVAGVHHEGRGGVIAEHVSDGDLVYLFRDRANRFSRNAVEVRLGNGLMIGYVPEELAKEMAPALDEGHPYHAWVKIVLTGGRVPIPVIVTEVLQKETRLPFALREGQIPSSPESFPRCVRPLLAAVPASEPESVRRMQQFTGLLRADLESLNGRTLQLEDLERYVNGCDQIISALRQFVVHAPARPGLLDFALPATAKAVREALAQVRPVLAPLANDAASADASRATRVLETADRVASSLEAPVQHRPIPPVAASEPATGPTDARASTARYAPGRDEPAVNEPTPRKSPSTLLVLVLLAVGAAIVGWLSGR